MVRSDLPQENLKSIFVISPIAKLDEDGFDFTRLFLEEIVRPAAAAAKGFSVPVRADEVRSPGSVTAKVVHDIVNADVCIADLTGRNPNVMYEVAIAHAADRPVILLQQEPGGPPFDFTDERVIRYSTRADEANRAREALTDHLANAHHEDENDQLKRTMHPVRVIFRDLQTRASATDPQQVILERLDSMTKSIQLLEMIAASQEFLHRPRERGFEGDRRVAVPDRLISSEADLIEQLDIQARSFLDNKTYAHLRAHLMSDHKDMQKLELLFARLAELSRSHGRPTSASVREVEELVRSLPPF